MLSSDVSDLVQNYANLSYEDRGAAIRELQSDKPDKYQEIAREFNSTLRKLILLSKDKQTAALKRIETLSPESAKQLALYIRENPGLAHEAQGYEHWLKYLGSHTFTRPLAAVQHKFWEWNWQSLMKLQDDIPLEPKELVGFLPHSRETGKSSNVEWACIAEGALLRGGYVIFYSGKQSQAEEHVTAIRDRIESEKVAKLYPWLGKPKMGTHGNRFGWGKEFLMTSGGWAIRPVGADVAIRGGKTLNLRPTLLVIDDLDELGDSPLVVEHKEMILTRSILPMGNDKTRVLVPQNPIHENSVVNRMLTGVSLALGSSIRTVFGELNDDGTMSTRPVPALRDFAYEVRQSEEGPYSVITKGESNWPGITRDNWETTLNRVGPPSFLAEYQHSMAVGLEQKVLPEYDDRNLLLHVISWDMFEKMYQTRRIPSGWACDVGLDIGFSDKHLSSWTFMAKVPEGHPLAGSIFRYRGRNFVNVSMDDQAVSVQKDIWPDENIQRRWMSHEKTGEQMLLSQKHGWNFFKCDSGKESGWAAWRHYLRTDRNHAHPFHTDTRDENTGLWKLGRPAFFDVVVHRQLRAPIDDFGLKIHRDSAFTQRRRPVKLTESGLTVDQPVKMGDDPNDSTRMIFSAPSFGPIQKSMTNAQKLRAAIPDGYRREELAQRPDLDPARVEMTSFMAEFLAAKSIKKPATIVDPWGRPVR